MKDDEYSTGTGRYNNEERGSKRLALKWDNFRKEARLPLSGRSQLRQRERGWEMKEFHFLGRDFF